MVKQASDNAIRVHSITMLTQIEEEGVVVMLMQTFAYKLF